MTRPWTYILALGAWLALAGCTGTTEEPLPVLLAVGVGGDEDPAVVLVQDDFNVANDDSPRDLTFVPGSRRATQAPVVDLDVTQRSGVRDVVVALTRDDATGNAYLERFQAEAVDPSDPQAFAPVAGGPIALHELEVPDGLTLRCPAALAVTREGRFAVVLDAPTACGGGADGPALLFVQLEGPESPRIVRAADSHDFPYLPVPPVLDQDRQPQRLYAVVDGPSPVLVAQELDESENGEEALGEGSDLAQIDALADAVSLAPSGDDFVVADEGEYVRLVDEEAGWEAGDAVDATFGLEAVVPLPFGYGTTVAYRTDEEVHVVFTEDGDEGTEDEDVHRAGGPIRDALVGPNDFLFALQDEHVLVVDFLAYRVDPGGDPNPTSVVVPELDQASAFTWIRGRPPTPSP